MVPQSGVGWTAGPSGRGSAIVGRLRHVHKRQSRSLSLCMLHVPPHMAFFHSAAAHPLRQQPMSQPRMERPKAPQPQKRTQAADAAATGPTPSTPARSGRVLVRLSHQRAPGCGGLMYWRRTKSPSRRSRIIPILFLGRNCGPRRGVYRYPIESSSKLSTPPHQSPVAGVGLAGTLPAAKGGSLRLLLSPKQVRCAPRCAPVLALICHSTR